MQIAVSSGEIRMGAGTVRYRDVLAAVWGGISRGTALFVAGLLLLGLRDGIMPVPEIASPLPPVGMTVIHLAAAAGLAILFCKPRPGWLRAAAICAIAMEGMLQLWIAWQYYALLAAGELRTAFPMPASLLIVLLLFLSVPALAQMPVRGSMRLAAASFVICLVGYPLFLMCSFGAFAHHLSADLIVVFGARAYADGSLSPVLADRVRTGCMLYRQGAAPRILFSGGPGDGEIYEAEAMQRMALRLGVPESAIILDRRGLDTRATVRDTRALFGTASPRVIVVSHFYHLPRIEMEYRRHGIRVLTVPAEQANPLVEQPYLMAREVVAWWAYALRG